MKPNKFIVTRKIDLVTTFIKIVNIVILKFKLFVGGIHKQR